jgi:hypothetical protein
MSMRAAIANARRRTGGRHRPDLPHPHAAEARHGGLVCPACLKFGRQECRQHRDRPKEAG